MKHKSFSNGRRAFLTGAAITGAALLCKPSLALAALANSEEIHTQTRLMLGTFVTLHAVHSSKALAEEALGRTFERISQLEAELTRHNSSPLTELNAQGKLLRAPQHLLNVLQHAARIHNLSKGTFDVSVAPLLNVYGKAKTAHDNFSPDAKELLAAKELVNAQEIHVSHDHVRLGKSDMRITLDGIAKGYIVDKASETLTELGIDKHLVNAGGDIRVSGQKNTHSPWRVGIENPQHKGVTIRNVDVQSAIATSGNYEMFFDKSKKYHHLIDPKLLQSAQYSASVSVIAPTALEADALATALSAMPSSNALTLINNLPKRECMLISAQGHVLTSHNWPS